jgi:hypothetical protein
MATGRIHSATASDWATASADTPCEGVPTERAISTARAIVA